jgi:hypothetical protein
MAIIAFLAASAVHAEAGADHTPLVGGWDIFDAPLAKGKVIWNVHDNGNSEKNVLVTFILEGAIPNHTYTVGAHFFDPSDPNVIPAGFGTWYTGEGCIWRPSAYWCVSAYDFGELTTDEYGDGSAHFNLYAPSGSHSLQFTVRYGVGCAEYNDGSNCSVCYQSGNSFANGLVTVAIPSN